MHEYHDANQGFPAGYVASGPYVNGATDTTPGWGWGAMILPYAEQGNLYNQFNLSQPVQNSPAIQTPVKMFVCPSDVVPPGAFAVTDANGRPHLHDGPVQLRRLLRRRRQHHRRDRQRRFLPQQPHPPDGHRRRDQQHDSGRGTLLRPRPGDVGRRGQRGLLQPGPVQPRRRARQAGPGAADLVLIHAGTNNNPTGRNLDDASSMHGVGSNFLFADGSVHFIRNAPSGSADSTTLQMMGTIAGGEVPASLDY